MSIFRKYRIELNTDITDDMLKDIYDLDKDFFDKDLLWDFEYQKKVFEKNKNSIICILNKGKVIGYINYLTISEKKYEDTLISPVIIDNYNLEDVVELKQYENNYITINSIVIKKEFQDGIVIKKLSNKFIKELDRLSNRDYKIKNLIGTAVSSDGRKFLENIGLKKYKTLEDGYDLYLLNDEKE